MNSEDEIETEENNENRQKKTVVAQNIKPIQRLKPFGSTNPRRAMALDLTLLAYLTAWYAGNYYYNIFNKNASKAGGGTEFAFTLATAQLAV